jgi:hypothetical protein
VGYDLHITRADDWIDGEKTPISRQRWKAFAAGEGRLTVGGWFDADIGRQPAWTYTSSDGKDFSLSWRNGIVDVTGRFSDQACRELAGLATALGAQLVGDEGESFSE